MDITNAKYWAIKYITKQKRANPTIAICGGVQAILHNEYDTVFGTIGNVNPKETQNGPKRTEDIQKYNATRGSHGHCNSNGMYHNPSDSSVKNTAQERCEHNQVVLAKKQDISLDDNGRLQEGVTLLPAFGEKYKSHGAIFTNDGVIDDIANSKYFIVHYSLQVDENGKINTIGIQHHIDVESKKGPAAIKMVQNLVNTYNKDSLTQDDCQEWGISNKFIGKQMTFEHFTNALKNINLYLNTPDTRDAATQFGAANQMTTSCGQITNAQTNFDSHTFRYHKTKYTTQATQTKP